jgi:hypothetical protein
MLISLVSVIPPFKATGGLLCDGLLYIPLWETRTGYDLSYLPLLHAVLILFCMLVTAVLTIISGGQAKRRQKEVALLSVPALALLSVTYLPASLMFFFGGYWSPEPFVGSADVVLALILTFMFFLRHDPA